MTKAASWLQGTSFKFSSTTLMRARVSLGLWSVTPFFSSISCHLHPQEGSDLSNLGSFGGQGTIGHRGSSSNDLLGVLLVGIDGARRERVTTEGDGRSTRSIRSTRGDGTLFDRTGSSESASNGRSQHSGVETLHVADW